MEIADQAVTRSQAKTQDQVLNDTEHEEIWDKMEVIKETAAKKQKSSDSQTERKPAKRRKSTKKEL